MYFLTNEYKSAVKIAHTEAERDRLIEMGLTLINDTQPKVYEKGGKKGVKNKNRTK